MNGHPAKLVSIMLCAVMIADITAVTFVNMNEDGSSSPLTSSPKMIWVDDDFADDPPNHKWNTIQEGVDDAERGDTVYVYNGTYQEQVVVKKTVFLEGEDPLGTTIDGGGHGYVLTIGPGTNSVHVTGFMITNSGEGTAGIGLSSTKKNTIDGNIISANSYGIRIGYVGYNVIVNNTISNNKYHGIKIAGVNNYNLISGNTISNNGVGIYLLADYNTISGNTILSDGYGRAISLGGSASHNVISGNTISTKASGIELQYNYEQHPNDNIISGNTIFNARYGILLLGSSSDIIANNTMVGNGIAVYGSMLEHWNTHIIDTSNTVNGKPVYYWKNVTGGTIPSGSGQVILANCTDVVIENQNVSDSTIGILLGFSSGNTIANNTVSSNKDEGIFLHSSNDNTIDGNVLSSNRLYGGVLLWLSDNNTVTNNIAFNNTNGIYLYSSNSTVVAKNELSENWNGITLVESSDNIIANNNASSNTRGISLLSSSNNTIVNNTASKNNLYGIHLLVSGFHPLSSNNNSIAYNIISLNNEYGVRLSDGSAYNLVYHNNFFDNTNQALDTNPANNDWHHPTLLEGNYWSDYTGVDDGSGNGKHAIASDLIGDTLVPHPGQGYDFYPCVVPSCWVAPENVPPVADAGPDQTVYEGDVVQFDGSGSYDFDAGWETTTVDSSGRVGGFTSMALDSRGYPHISYMDSDNWDLKYARWNGSSWNVEGVDTAGKVGSYSSIAVDSNDNPHISYYEIINYSKDGDLKYAKWTGTNWSIETVDSDGDAGYHMTSIALDSKGYPHIAYYVDEYYYDLRYARWNGSDWNIEVVDSSGNVGLSPSITLDGNDYPHICYYAATNTELKYARWTGTNWSIKAVDSPGIVGWDCSIALDCDDHPHISYKDRSKRALKYAKWNGTNWSIDTVAPIGLHGGGLLSIALDRNDNPHISYYFWINWSDGDLRYTRWTGTNWSIETVDSVGDVGSHSSIALDNSDVPHISYYDFTNSDLKYANRYGSIVSYDWDFGDGSPHGSGVRLTHVYSSPGVYNVTLTVTDAKGATDTDNCIITVLPRNQPPVANANGPYFVDEGTQITLDGSNSYDRDGDTLQYRWDLDNDGIWDTAWSSSPYLGHTWGDDYSGQVALQVSDGEFTDTDTANITVSNVAPTVELRMLAIYVNVSVRIAGEKWHDVSLELYEDDVLLAEGNLVRYPGSPNDQMLYLSGFEVNISRKYSATVRYTPEDDPINGQSNGANPCWIVLGFDDDDEVRLHHTFNIQHPETYIWEIDLTRAILLHGITFEATAYDPGADDLTFIWDFGDGTIISNFYPNQNQTFPVEIAEIITHAFPGDGRFTVTLNVEDDDGGVGVAIVDIVIP